MSTTLDPTPAPQPPADDHRAAKADLKAAKARAKAMRPWFKKKRFILPLAILLVAIFANLGGGGDDTASTASTAAQPEAADDAAAEPAAAEPAEPALAALNTPVQDGKFEFTVHGMNCGETLIGSESFGSKAQGQFCIVDLTVANIGDEAQYFLGDNAVLYNAAGQKYSADSEAAIYLDDSSSLLEEINPGNSLDGKIVFDVPQGADITKMELHDSMFSGGVDVAVR